MEDRAVYLYKKIMDNGAGAFEEIKTLEEAKEVIKLMATQDMLRFMVLRSSERMKEVSV